MSTILNTLKILDTDQKNHLIVILILVLFTIILETISIGLVLPVVTLLVNYDELIKYETAALILNFLNLTDQNKIILYGLSLLVFVYSIKNIYLAFFTYYQAKFVFNLNLDLSKKIYFFYLNQPYEFHLEKNSSELIRNISNETGKVIESLGAIINLVTEMLVLICLIMLLIFIEPLTAIITFLVIGGAGFISNAITKKPIRNIGQERLTYQALVLKNIMQGLNSIKETLLMWKQNSFINQFNKDQFKLLDSTRRLSFINSLPRLWLEILALTGLLVISYIMLSQNFSVDKLLPVLSLFAAAALRMLPGIGKIINSFQVLTYCKPSVAIISKEIANISFNKNYNNIYIKPNTKLENDNNFFSNNFEIDLRSINFKYPNTKKFILEDLNLTIKKGECIGIVGSSGAGKSTFIDILIGLLKPENGKILLDDFNINSILKRWQTNIGYVPQFVFLSDESIKNNIAFGVEETDINFERLNSAIEKSQLKEFIIKLPHGVNTIIGEQGARISGGQRQRIGIARALYNNPEILIFDESTSSLDTETENKFVEVIKTLQKLKTIIIVSHRYSTVKNCNKILTLKNGKFREN